MIKSWNLKYHKGDLHPPNICYEKQYLAMPILAELETEGEYIK